MKEGPRKREYIKEWYAKRKASGMCRRCTDPVYRGQLYCERHREIERAYAAKLRRARGQKVRGENRLSEEEMKAKRRAYALVANKQRIERLMSAGLCTSCGRVPPHPGLKSRCRACADRAIKYWQMNKKRIERARLKREGGNNEQ